MSIFRLLTVFHLLSQRCLSIVSPTLQYLNFPAHRTNAFRSCPQVGAESFGTRHVSARHMASACALRIEGSKCLFRLATLMSDQDYLTPLSPMCMFRTPAPKARADDCPARLIILGNKTAHWMHKVQFPLSVYNFFSALFFLTC